MQSRPLVATLLSLLAACGGTLHATRPAEAQPPFQVAVVGHGPPMILIPGLASSGKVWDGVVAHYQDRYTCHVLTLAGFAGVPPGSGPLLPAVHAALAHYIRSAHLDHPVVVGHSLGGFSGIWLAATDPELVGQLIVVDSAPSLSALTDPHVTPDAARDQANQMRLQLRTAAPDQLRKFQRMSVRGMVSDPAKQELAFAWSRASDLDTVGDALHFVLTTDLRPLLPRVQARTLVVGTWVGYQPYVTRAEVLERFQNQYAGLRGAQVVLDDTARHFVMWDDEPGLLQRMDGFLSPPVAALPR